MRNKFLCMIALFLAIFTSFAQTIPNGGFENWSMPNGYNIPDDWATLNDITGPLNVFTCAKGTPGSPGSAYLKLTSKSVAGIGVVPGIAVSGQLSSSNYFPTGGFPFAFHPTFFTGKWQYMGATSNDVGSVTVALTHFDNSTGIRDTVAIAAHSLSGMEMSWVNFSLPFTYLNNNSADSCIIFLNASGPIPQASSYLYVDNLAFTIPTEISEFHKSCGLNVFPIPARESITISWKEVPQSAIFLNVFNSLGQCILSENQIPSNQMVLNVSLFPTGTYFLKVSDEENSSTLQFIVR